MAENKEVYEKLNDYTISVTNDFERMSEADPELRRIFNFKARQVTNIYAMWYSTGISTNMQVQRFSELDSLEEVADMHKRLCEMGGNPPGLTDVLQPLSKPGPKSLSL